jgi:hypothetical protein
LIGSERHKKIWVPSLVKKDPDNTDALLPASMPPARIHGAGRSIHGEEKPEKTSSRRPETLREPLQSGPGIRTLVM